MVLLIAAGSVGLVPVEDAALPVLPVLPVFPVLPVEGCRGPVSEHPSTASTVEKYATPTQRARPRIFARR
jgi:hypothetical protein